MLGCMHLPLPAPDMSRLLADFMDQSKYSRRHLQAAGERPPLSAPTHPPCHRTSRFPLPAAPQPKTASIARIRTHVGHATTVAAAVAANLPAAVASTLQQQQQPRAAPAVPLPSQQPTTQAVTDQQQQEVLHSPPGTAA